MRVLRQLNRHEEAISMYRVANDAILTHQSTCLYALILIDREAYAAALKALAKIPAISSQARHAYFLRALATAGIGNQDQARAMMRALQSLDDD